MARFSFLLILASALGACGGGSDDGPTDARMDSAVTQDASVDSDVNDGASEDADVLDSSEPEQDAAIEDSGPEPNICPDGSVVTDAGTQSLATVCARMCNTYLPTCGGAPPNCMTTCMMSALTPSQLGRVYVCTDVSSPSQCAAAADCLTVAAGCP